MKMMKIQYIYLALAIVFNSAANLVIKGFASERSESFYDLITNFPLIVGVMLFGINFIFYTKALHYLNISVAYPIVVGFSIILIISLSMLFLHERLTFVQVGGIGLIIAGIVLVFYQ